MKQCVCVCVCDTERENEAGIEDVYDQYVDSPVNCDIILPQHVWLLASPLFIFFCICIYRSLYTSVYSLILVLKHPQISYASYWTVCFWAFVEFLTKHCNQEATEISWITATSAKFVSFHLQKSAVSALNVAAKPPDISDFWVTFHFKAKVAKKT